MTFVNLTRALDAVSRDGLSIIMVMLECPNKFKVMVTQFRDGMLHGSKVMVSFSL